MAIKGCFVLPATRREIRFMLRRKSAGPAKTWKTSRSILTEGGARTGTASRHFPRPPRSACTGPSALNARGWASGQRGNSSSPSVCSRHGPKPILAKHGAKCRLAAPPPAAVDVKGGTVLRRERHSLSSVTSSGSLAAGRADMTRREGKLRLGAVRSGGTRTCSQPHQSQILSTLPEGLLNPGNGFRARCMERR